MTNSWPKAPLGSVCDITMGQAPPGDCYNIDGKGWPLISGAGDFSNGLPKAKKFTSSKTRLSQPGDIVIGIRATIGEKVLSDGVYCLGRGVAGLRPSPQLEDRYLWHWLTMIKGDLAALGRGATFKQVNKSDVAELQIPLPPLSEQRRIAGILDKADELRSKRKTSMETLETLTNAVFVDLFGDSAQSPVTIGDGLHDHPQGWKWELLTNVARLATGHTPDRERPDYWDGDIPWISLTEIRRLDGRIASHTDLTVTPEGIAHSSAVVLPPGTVCFSRTASIGFVTVTGTEMATSQDFVNWVCGDRLDPVYLMTALLVSRHRLRSLSTGSTHKTIYLRVAEKFRVLVPPMELQRRFTELAMELWTCQVSQAKHLSLGNDLFGSLQQRAFQGAL